MPRCPVCSSPVDLATCPTVPFCSDRCRTIDLGRWLDEAYGLPDKPRDAEEEDEVPPAPADEEE